MTATARLKQLFFIAAALALVGLGLVAAFAPASPARAADNQPCEPSEDEVVTQWFVSDPGAPWAATGKSRVKTEGTPATYTDWVDEGDPIRTEENNAPGGGEFVQYVSKGEVDDSTEGHWDDTVVTFYVWTGGNSSAAPPVYSDETETSLHSGWNATNGNPQGGPHGTAPLYSPYEAGGGPTTASWFLKAGAFVPGVTDTDYLWQKQVRTLVPGTDDVLEYEYTKTIPGNDCEPEGPDCEANPQAEGCPPVDNGKKVVVCKYVGTPPGVLDHIIIVNESSLSQILDDDNNPFTGEFPFEWTDAQGQTTEGSKAIRYAEEGEQAKDVPLSECTDEEEPECPNGDLNGPDPGCEAPDPGPGTCPDGPKAGQEIPEGETEEEFCDEEDKDEVCPEGTDNHDQEIPEGETEEEFCDDDDEDEVCPEGTDNHDQEIPEGETEESFCNDDDVDPGPTCEEDPTQEHCDEDKPNNPNQPNSPGQPNSPSNGPTVKGAQASSPNAAPAVAGTSAGTPAARVPTAIAAGLGGNSESAGNGGNLGLLGIAATMLGAALIGVSFRPRRGRSLTG